LKRPSKPRKRAAAISDADYQHLAAFRRLLREFLRFSEEAALAAGVSPQQHQAMLVIRGVPKEGHLTVGELAGQLQIKHHSAVGLVKRMIAEGLVAKSEAPYDRRQVLVWLTAHGKRTLELLAPAHKAELSRIAPVLRKILDQLESLS
jgi:DNA-binding MarR family transcriptional regulator